MLTTTGIVTSFVFQNGLVQLDLASHPAHRLVSSEGHVYAGLPIIAYVVERIENVNARPRVIGYYADATTVCGRLRCSTVGVQGEQRNCAPN